MSVVKRILIFSIALIFIGISSVLVFNTDDTSSKNVVQIIIKDSDLNNDSWENLLFAINKVDQIQGNSKLYEKYLSRYNSLESTKYKKSDLNNNPYLWLVIFIRIMKEENPEMIFSKALDHHNPENINYENYVMRIYYEITLEELKETYIKPY